MGSSFGDVLLLTVRDVLRYLSDVPGRCGEGITNAAHWLVSRVSLSFRATRLRAFCTLIYAAGWLASSAAMGLKDPAAGPWWLGSCFLSAMLIAAYAGVVLSARDQVLRDFWAVWLTVVGATFWAGIFAVLFITLGFLLVGTLAFVGLCGVIFSTAVARYYGVELRFK